MGQGQGHVGQGQMRVPNKGRWAHDNVKLLHFHFVQVIPVIIATTLCLLGDQSLHAVTLIYTFV